MLILDAFFYVVSIFVATFEVSRFKKYVKILVFFKNGIIIETKKSAFKCPFCMILGINQRLSIDNFMIV